MKNSKVYLIFLPLALALSACTKTVQIDNTPAPVIESIAKSTQEIHTDLQQLLALKQLSPHPYQSVPTPTEGPLSKRITLKWVGSPDEAVKALSTLVGYQTPKVVGKKPANTANVSINAVDRPAAEVLEDIGLQMGDKAGVSIGSDQITIIYEGAYE